MACRACHAHGREWAGYKEAESMVASLERKWWPGGGQGMALALVSSPVRVLLQ